MKALQITGPGTVEIRDVPMPTVGDHQVLVQIQVVATCPRWDIHMLGGQDMFEESRSPKYPLPPGFPGHEAAGVVRETGRGVLSLRPGDRVAALEHIPEAGAYAEYLSYRESDLIKLPDEVSDLQAVSFELLKCVLIGLDQFGDLRGRTMLVAGLGPAGVLAMQAARIWGAARVVGVDVSHARVEWAQSLGLGEVMHVEQLGGRRFDLGYDCVGHAASVQHVLDRTDRHVVIFGVLRGDLTFRADWWGRGKRLESYGYRAFTDRDRELLLDAVVRGGLDTTCIQTHESLFSRYAEAVELLRAQQAVKVRFYPGREWGSDGS